MQKISILLLVFSVYGVKPKSVVTWSNLSNKYVELLTKVSPKPN